MALLAAAPAIVPSSSLGREGAPAPSERLGVAVIGLGGQGSGLARHVLGLQDARLVAVCDAYRSRGQQFKSEVEQTQKGCEAYQDFREVLDRPDVDAVFIAAPENWHALMAATAARAGKDVYCEKALSLTVGEGRELCRTIRRTGRVLQVGTQQRSSGNFRHACELVRSGYLGRLQEVRVGVPGGRVLPKAEPMPPPPDIDYDLWLGPAPWTPYNDLKCTFNWYFMSDYCAGWIQSWGVHHCDIALWGAPQLAQGRVTVEGKAEFPKEGLADTSLTWIVKITASDGTLLSFADNTQPGHEQGVRFVGEDGWIHVNRGAYTSQPQSLVGVDLKPGDTRLRRSDDHILDLFGCMRSRIDPVSTVESGHAATSLTLIADIATRLRRPLTWDWKAERFADDDMANRLLSRVYRSPWRL